MRNFQEHITVRATGSAASGLDHRLWLRMRGEPQRACSTSRIEPELLPPSGFVTVMMELAMMPPAERDRELITDSSTERAVLRDDGRRRADVRRRDRFAGPQTAHALDREHAAFPDASKRTCRPTVMAP